MSGPPLSLRPSRRRGQTSTISPTRLIVPARPVALPPWADQVPKAARRAEKSGDYSEFKNVISRSSAEGPLLEIEPLADLGRLHFVRVVLYKPVSEVEPTIDTQAGG